LARVRDVAHATDRGRLARRASAASYDTVLALVSVPTAIVLALGRLGLLHAIAGVRAAAVIAAAR
jgi:hypothetical protein